MAVPARICTLYVATDLRELLAGRRLSVVASTVLGLSCDGVVSQSVSRADASSCTSTICSILGISEATLASSPRLVGGVEMDGDALDMARMSACLSVRTVMLDTVEDVDVGEVSRSAMVVGDKGCNACRGRYL